MRIKQHSKLGIIFMILLYCFAIAGCSNHHTDLVKFMQQVKKMPVKQPEPLPKAEVYKPFYYSADGLRSPFALPNNLDSDAIVINKQRQPEPLEQYPLDSLTYVGMIQQGGLNWGLIQTKDNKVYRLSKGNYIGKNNGTVVEISETQVKVKERIKNRMGQWETRIITLKVASHETQNP